MVVVNHYKYATMKKSQFLDLPFPILAPDITVDHFPKVSIVKIDWRRYLSKELIEFFTQHNMKIYHVVSLFNGRDVKRTIIHSDAQGGDYTKLNFIFGTGTSKMCWYEPISADVGVSGRTDNKEPYVTYTPEQVTLIESRSITKPALVQVGTPHNVVDMSEDRLCIGVVFTNATTGKRPSMAECIEIFKSYLALD